MPNHEHDSFWALSKYAENVEECAVQLDHINKTIFPRLVEIPQSAEDGELSWAGLRGMRNRLAHKFWDIDEKVLWETVTRDFPRLHSLLDSLMVSDTIGNVDAQGVFIISTKRLKRLPISAADDEISLGNSIPFLYFDSNGKAQCFRIRKGNGDHFHMTLSEGGEYTLTVYGVNSERVAAE